MLGSKNLLSWTIYILKKSRFEFLPNLKWTLDLLSFSFVFLFQILSQNEYRISDLCIESVFWQVNQQTFPNPCFIIMPMLMSECMVRHPLQKGAVFIACLFCYFGTEVIFFFILTMQCKLQFLGMEQMYMFSNGMPRK